MWRKLERAGCLTGPTHAILPEREAGAEQQNGGPELESERVVFEVCSMKANVSGTLPLNEI